MKYHVWQAQADLMAHMRLYTEATAQAMRQPWLAELPAARRIAAACTVFASAQVTHSRPSFGIERTMLGSGASAREVLVHEEAIHVLPFCTLLRFAKEDADDALERQPQPRVLLVAPMSGHFATLLRDTVRTMLPEHDVYITDWHNARDVPLMAGAFGLDQYTRYLIEFLEVLGEGAHMLAVCQPCVPALAATAIMAEDGHPATPRSLTLMAGPVDVRVSPTEVNRLATSKPYSWFERNMIGTVPQRHRGAGREVYPGFVQLTAFMSMNLERHMEAFRGMYRDLANGELERAAATRAFYAEYFAVLDLPAEFYLETIRDIFQHAALACGELRFEGRPVRPGAIRRTALLTVEGERDDICALGQTMAAHDLCKGIPAFLKSHHMQAGVGHYGVFSGRRWTQQTYPIVREMIYATD
ncbi:polyhydroxyalkanoate depolymerase|uniref:polyhydroxyalkanoate depolymerase n=1 Tax=Noviherbaspirillum sp. L7-7A TaxID=2850560 RepID=UPI001C2BB8DA|nr:polyhydroxyalkanoate depolymerase [Noviherbaspirillum sp. L7-7A]MBV0878991.1 polyhydroxyalkanoate depolymerase [Noviherbaspirillum sp. L7-7A]